MHPQILCFRLGRATHRRRLSNKDIIRCLKRFLAREINELLPPPSAQISLATCLVVQLDVLIGAPMRQQIRTQLEPGAAPRRWPSGEESVDDRQTAAPQLLDAPTGGE
jgi:hypothetical protein